MKKKAIFTTWRVLWTLLILNAILLLCALFDQGIWYLVSSLLWSLGILRYHSKTTGENKKTIVNTFSNDSPVKRDRYIESQSKEFVTDVVGKDSSKNQFKPTFLKPLRRPF